MVLESTSRMIQSGGGRQLLLSKENLTRRSSKVTSISIALITEKTSGSSRSTGGASIRLLDARLEIAKVTTRQHSQAPSTVVKVLI